MLGQGQEGIQGSPGILGHPAHAGAPEAVSRFPGPVQGDAPGRQGASGPPRPGGQDIEQGLCQQALAGAAFPDQAQAVARGQGEGQGSQQTDPVHPLQEQPVDDQGHGQRIPWKSRKSKGPAGPRIAS